MGNENKAIDYSVMLADLYAKRAGIDAAIAGLIAASGGGYLTPSDANSGASFAPNGTGDHQPTELPRGAFLNKSLPAAVKLFLSAMKKKQSAREIATALREGGVESTSPNFENVLTGCLYRMKTNGELLRFKDGWALAEFYPEHLRRSLSSQDGAAAKRKTANKKANKGQKSSKTAKATQEKPRKPEVAEEGLGSRIEGFLNNNAGVYFAPQDIAKHLGVLPQVVFLLMGRLAKKHGWEKNADGKFSAGFHNVQEMPKAV
jgi:hypothetical protein